MKTEHLLADAEAVANELIELLSPSCERIVIAGSIRRRKPNPSDIELLCIPKESDNLFCADALDEAINALMAGGLLALRPSVKGVTSYGPKNKLLEWTRTGIAVDVFSTNHENWGMSLLVRTGSARFNVKVMAHLKAIGYAGHAYAGISNRQGIMMDCPDEETVFRYLSWDYIEPSKRE